MGDSAIMSNDKLDHLIKMALAYLIFVCVVMFFIADMINGSDFLIMVTTFPLILCGPLFLIKMGRRYDKMDKGV